MKVLYAKSYIGRELYVIEKDSKYLMVYASSGMNPGRKGRIIPFNFLSVPNRQTTSRGTPGYIFKEYYYQGRFQSHFKDPGRDNETVQKFLLDLEEFISAHAPKEIPYTHLRTSEDILKIAEPINADLVRITEGVEPFDWSNLTCIK